MIDESVKVAVLETRLNNIETSLNEHKRDIKEFVRENDAQHKEVQQSITGLQRIVYAGLGIIGFITFVSQAMPVIDYLMTSPHGEISGS